MQYLWSSSLHVPLYVLKGGAQVGSRSPDISSAQPSHCPSTLQPICRHDEVFSGVRSRMDGTLEDDSDDLINEFQIDITGIDRDQGKRDQRHWIVIGCLNERQIYLLVSVFWCELTGKKTSTDKVLDKYHSLGIFSGWSGSVSSQQKCSEKRNDEHRGQTYSQTQHRQRA